MSFVTGDHSSITVYAEPLCPQCQRIKMVLAEKDVGYKFILVEKSKKDLPQEFMFLNPSGDLPFFSDRNLLITCPPIVCEYLDERFPLPPLMPVEPSERARLKTGLVHIDEHWFTALHKASSFNKKTAARAVQFLSEEIERYSDMFRRSLYFMSDEITLLDCALAPILWRLPSIGIEVRHKAVLKYQKHLFLRPGFRQSLSEEEAELNPEAL